jgi:homoserine dehydrogenase
LLGRAEELRARHGITFRITGIATRRLGWIAAPNGLDPAHVGRTLLSDKPVRSDQNLPDVQAWLTAAPNGLDPAHVGRTLLSDKPVRSDQKLPDVQAWLTAAQADVLFEATSLNVETGQPAVDHIRAALTHGAHAITANKGPIVHAYRELRDLAAARGKRFLFESTVMDGVPIFSFFDQLPTIHLQGFHGILNSTTNVILSGMEEGLSFDDSLKKAQALGIAETDATHDIDGWDAAVKTAALITVLMDIPVRLEDIYREGIRDLTTNAVRNGRRDGWPFKLLCRAQRVGDSIKASVAPEKVLSSSPMGKISGASSYIHFETDIFPGLAITEENPGLHATAYGMLADFVRAVSETRSGKFRVRKDA